MSEVDLIETPENVELERRLAGIGSRFLAGLVDVLLIFLIVIVLLVLLWAVFLASFVDKSRIGTTWGLIILIVAAFILYWGYFAIFELATNGQSPGKKYMKIRVVKLEGGAITFPDVAIRNLLRAVDAMPGVLYFVAGLCMFVTKRCQRLGDLAAGTLVVDESVADYTQAVDKRKGRPLVVEPIPATPQGLREVGLTGEECRLLANYQARRNGLTQEIRRRILPRLMAPVLARMDPAARPTTLAAMEYLLDRTLMEALAPASRAQEPPAPTDTAPPPTGEPQPAPPTPPADQNKDWTF